MTCVVGVIDYCKKNVVIGADDGSVQGSLLRLRKDPKVFRLSKYIVAAFTGSFRMGQILRFSSEPEKDIISSIPNSEIEKFVVLTIIPKLIVNFDNNRCLRKESAQWKMPGEIMLGIKDQLFVIGQDFQVARYQEPFAVIGVGKSFALGFLRAALSYGDFVFDKTIRESWSTKDYIFRAIAIAGYYDPRVGSDSMTAISTSE